MNVLALTRYGPDGASSRVRFLQYVPALQRAGINVDVSPLWDATYLDRLYKRDGARRTLAHTARRYACRAFELPMRARRADVIWLEGELFPWLPAIAESLSSIPIIVDYDDAHFHKYDTHPLSRAFLGAKIDTIMRAAAAVVVGNPYLGTRAHAAGARHIEVLPSVVDLERWPVQEAHEVETQGLLRVGWIGTPHTAHYLDVIGRALRRAARIVDVRVILVGADRSISGVEVECRRWADATEAKNVASFDVGVMPLPDFPWERGKSGYKLVQYMASARPAIASPVGVNGELLGDAGVLARTEDEWVEALVGFARNPTTRKEMGMRGRIRVERHYSLAVTAPRLVEIFQRIG
jgi:glycosyltransferase involved in cell wall biosynthesis